MDWPCLPVGRVTVRVVDARRPFARAAGGVPPLPGTVGRFRPLLLCSFTGPVLGRGPDPRPAGARSGLVSPRSRARGCWPRTSDWHASSRPRTQGLLDASPPEVWPPLLGDASAVRLSGVRRAGSLGIRPAAAHQRGPSWTRGPRSGLPSGEPCGLGVGGSLGYFRGRTALKELGTRRFGPPAGDPELGPRLVSSRRLLSGDREPGAGLNPPAGVRGRAAGGPDGCGTDPREGAPTVSGPWVQCAFNLSMFSVSCNSHYDTQFAAVFIDPRAE